MSDVEEPPAKISKTEKTAQIEELEEMDEGQEEWLSEGLLTDDDNYQAADQDGTDSNLGNTSQEDLDETFLDETMLSGDQSMESQNVSQDASQGNVTQEPETSQDITKSEEPPAETIEQTLNNLENQTGSTVKKEGKVEIKEKQSEKSDGNDTDDLLRLLGDNDDKSKKKVLVKTKDKTGKSRSLKDKAKNKDDTGSSDDDDEYIFNSSSVQKLRVAKNALIRKPATKAEPEDMSDGDDETDCESSDEATTMRNVFASNKPSNKAAKSTTKPPYTSQTAKKVVKIGNANIEILPEKPTPKRPTLPKTSTPSKPILKTVSKSTNSSTPVKTLLKPAAKKDVKQKKPPPPEHEEIINEQEFLEEDDFDLEDDFTESLDMERETLRNRQMIMRPEQMDEEIPTDAESHTNSDASVYDELPSSDSEDMDDWFNLDIRAERASDFLPMLGDKAYELLTEEKRRVGERLTSLRDSIAQLHCSGQKQAEQLRKAAVTLAELDDMLKAA